jgi:hypothetical protein
VVTIRSNLLRAKLLEILQADAEKQNLRLARLESVLRAAGRKMKKAPAS